MTSSWFFLSTHPKQINPQTPKHSKKIGTLLSNTTFPPYQKMIIPFGKQPNRSKSQYFQFRRSENKMDDGPDQTKKKQTHLLTISLGFLCHYHPKTQSLTL
jgi:hypothetical protein